MPVNRLISELQAAAEAHPRGEKILIVPERAMGHHILEILVRAGTPWINFRAETLTSLARDVAGGVLAAEGLRPLPPAGFQAVVDDVFNTIADSGELRYFQKHPVNKGIVEALTRTVRELRICGVSSAAVPAGSLISPEKESDLKHILAGVEDALEKRNLYDEARLISTAADILGRNGPQIGEPRYFLPRRYVLCGIERDFVDALCGSNLVVLVEDPACGLPPPRGMRPTDDSGPAPECRTDVERLRWLFKSADAPAPFRDGTIEIFRALGRRNEVREVLRRIAAEGATVDDAEIVYTDTENYADLLYALCEKLGIPATFAEGVGAFMTATGRVLLGFLLWIKEDFDEVRLRRIFESPAFRPPKASPDEGPGGPVLAHLLRTSGVGWGRVRYSEVLPVLSEKLRVMASAHEKEGETDEAEKDRRRADDAESLRRLCDDLLELVPEKLGDGRIDFGALCAGCVEFLRKYVKAGGENEAAFIKAAMERLGTLEEILPGPMLFDGAMEKVVNAVSGIRVGASWPKPGCLHISHYRQGARSGRGRTFVVGLDEGKFPSRSGQDPVLLDEERAKISESLELSAGRMSRNLYDMAALLSGLRGKAVFSYSAYDIKEDRTSFPSSILLQVFRIREGAPDADYDRMLGAIGEPVGFGGGSGGGAALDGTDWWLSRLVSEGVLLDGGDAVKEVYQGIRDGLRAWTARAGDRLTEYDGNIHPRGHELDPRKNGVVMSCSRLEKAAACPFAYFLAYILNVRKPEETKKDPGVWLDPMERGTLLHEVFQEYVSEVMDSKEAAAAGNRKAAIEKILDETVETFRKLKPPPSDNVFRRECLQLRRDVGVFLELDRGLGTEPVEVEMGFGGEGQEAVRIPVGDGEHILLRGRIDRVDREPGTSRYHVWDYKTGGTHAYDQKDYVKGGEQIQHALYALAAETMLRASGEDPGAEVVQAGYIFPTEKGTKDGEDGVIARPTDDPERWRIALDRLLELIASGTFILNHDKKKDISLCKYCDYPDICGGKAAREAMSRKSENPENIQFAPWKALKDCK
ncbi:MAG: PD-(D/E)XK nuclease family protein [Acidobacteriota bacterium]|nr:PD-(D/E)XK nuclease family protein [Acidobacteriota bacterium]